jgi:hypothetical protein
MSQSKYGANIEMSLELTRPNDVLAYAIGDIIADSTTVPTMLKFTDASLTSFGSGYITKARVSTNQSANVGTYRLWLFETDAPAALAGDNTILSVRYADNVKRAGYIDIPALATEGAGSDAAFAVVSNLRLPYTTDMSKTLYGLLQAKAVFTPAALQKFYIELTADQIS